MSLTYGDMFDFVEKRVNFRKDEKGNHWDCSATIERPFLHEFFALNSIDPETQERVLKILNATGGYCDCEILFNSAFGFPRDMPLSERNTDIILEKRLEGAREKNTKRIRLHRNELQRKRRKSRGAIDVR